ncbi:MAG: (Fe-S)-binding protein [Nanoarchaeota archaeon]|nr:(Fe-S)-binding protein [Nanoarchaeota archaeon]
MFKLFEKLVNKNVLYYPGCMTKFVLKDKQDNYKKILEKLGIEFIMLKDEEFCCGSPVLNAGYEKDFENLKNKNLNLFKKYGVSKIITNCPGCYSMFKDFYGLKVEHISQTIFNNRKKLKKKFHEEDISYHDPCHLGRYSKIYDEPREVLKLRGINLVEFDSNREYASCCGAGGGLRNNVPNLADGIAKNVLKQCKTEKLVTTCPMCYYHFKENSNGKLIMEFSEVFV